MAFDVGGVLYDRPFKVRRLGHFGINCSRQAEAFEFYTKVLGFRLSDPHPQGHRVPEDRRSEVEGTDTDGYFLRHGGDHHAFVIFPKKVRDTLGGFASSPGVTINQITWQVGSLREVVSGHEWFVSTDQPINRVGRDMPGSNWHTYPVDPEMHVNELFYGIEQIGWDGFAKPKAMHERGFHDAPELPQISEQQEVERALEAGIPLDSGVRYLDPYDETFDVDGVLLPRPFKITGIGPVRLFVRDLELMTRYYQEVIGLTVTDELEFQGHRCVFLRCNTEHHSMALYPIELRDSLGLSEHTTLMSFGLRVANYRQLRDAAGYLRARGATLVDLPGELFPGIDFALHVRDPDGHVMQLYYTMEQVGWDGRARTEDRILADTSAPEGWPETIDARPDTYLGEVFLGPWG